MTEIVTVFSEHCFNLTKIDKITTAFTPITMEITPITMKFALIMVEFSPIAMKIVSITTGTRPKSIDFKAIFLESF